MYGGNIDDCLKRRQAFNQHFKLKMTKESTKALAEPLQKPISGGTYPDVKSKDVKY
jgi:hypothetical protein